MPISTTKSTNVWAAVTRIARNAFFGEASSVAEQVPLALNNEPILSVNAAGTGTNKLLKSDAFDITTLTDKNGNESLRAPATAAAVNEVTVTNAATGSAPSISSSGDDANIGLAISTKGTGNYTVSAGGVNRAIYNGVAKAIADAAATSLFDVACAAGVMVGGLIFYQVEASDGTDHQALAGMVSYAAVNKAGTLTLAITEVAGNQAKALSNGISTLTLAWTFVAGASKGTVKLQPTGSLIETTFRVTYSVLPLIGALTIL